MKKIVAFILGINVLFGYTTMSIPSLYFPHAYFMDIKKLDVELSLETKSAKKVLSEESLQRFALHL